MLIRLSIILYIVYNEGIAIDDETRNKKIEELETQKSELFQQINTAIDQSVKSLLKANDTEAIMGLEYMRDLKEHIKELNKTGTDFNDEKVMDLDTKSDLENRRSFKGLEFFKKKTRIPKDDPFDFDAVLKPKKISPKEWKEMLSDRIKMQQKLDDWILQRQKEKERLEKYHMGKKRLIKSGKYENCPRFGYQGKKKKVEKGERHKSRHCGDITDPMNYEKCISLYKGPNTSENDDYRALSKRKFPKKNKYPCCRKCCKKSYMGCL